MSFWLEIFLGVGLAVLTIYYVRDFDRDMQRLVFALILPVMAFFYLIFAALFDEPQMTYELSIFILFLVLGLIGYKRFQFLLIVGYFAHGLVDAGQFIFEFNKGVPHWWPPFCIAYDWIILVFVYYLSKDLVRKRIGTT